MIALVRRRLPEASPGAVDRAMRTLGASRVLRAKGVRTTILATDGRRAGDDLHRMGTEPNLCHHAQQSILNHGPSSFGPELIGPVVKRVRSVAEDINVLTPLTKKAEVCHPTSDSINSK